MMQKFSFEELELKGAYLIKPFFADDIRGGFVKDYSKELFLANGIDYDLKEVFYTISHKGVIRALHFQEVNQQPKLVRCVSGKVFDVIVDLRANSSTYKQWIACELSAENHFSFYVPRGFAHGFVSLEDGTVMLYQCDGKYDPETDTGIRFDDPDIAIDWPIDERVAIHSERDLRLQSFREYLKNPMEI